MKINSNITAYTTNNAYLINERRLSNANTKLSSGFKINKAGDDPASYAIGSRMKSQLLSMDKVKTNATTGASAVETAESAITEISTMLQRMNELAVKAANGTMSDSDRGMIMEEVDQLKDEINRIKDTTEFNGMTLLDGTFENKGYCKNDLSVKVQSYSDKTMAGTYSMRFTYEQSYKLETYGVTGDVADVFGSIFPKVSDVKKNIPTDPTDPVTYSVTVSGEKADGTEISRTYEVNEEQIKAGNGSVEFTDEEDETKKIILNFEKDYKYTVSDPATPPVNGVKSATDLFGLLSGVNKNCYTSTRTVDDTDYVTVTSRDGTEVTFEITDRDAVAKSGSEKDLTMDITGKGAMRLQVGVDEGEVLAIGIPEMSLINMHIDDLDMSTEQSATKAIKKIEYGLEYVNSVRSRLGAYENRLDSTISYVDASDEALTTSFSRITDTDMAEEMTEYTNLQVLTQAGMSMLAQANEFPQQALQLLQ